MKTNLLTPLRRPLSFWVLLTLGMATALACRYSIRDTGFVDLGADTHSLLFRNAPVSLATAYRQAAAASLLDANIEWKDADTAGTPPDADSPSGTGAVKGTTGKSEAEPELILVAADQREFVVARGDALSSDPVKIQNLLEQIALSPLRDRLYRESIDAFALVLLIQGTDTAANDAAERAITAAIGDITRVLPRMPKPVDHPPRLLTIHPDQIASERITLWGMEIEPEIVADPRVAIIYGRGRRLGAPLEGPLITRTALQERLSLIGQDCECELDRAWLKGPLFPGRWDADLQSKASQSLGFDPENPLIRTEISRIVLRGPQTPTTRKMANPVLAFGYSEELLDEGPDVQEGDSQGGDSQGGDGVSPSSSTPTPQDSISPSDAASPSSSSSTQGGDGVPPSSPPLTQTSPPAPPEPTETSWLDSGRTVIWGIAGFIAAVVVAGGTRWWLRAGKDLG